MNIKNEPLFKEMEDFVREGFKNHLYDGKPYTVHTNDVVDRLIKHGAGLIVALAGGLHDTTEDLGTTHEELTKRFGVEVADIVDKVSDRPGKNRAERHRNTYPITRTCPQAVMVKLADRISNMNYCLKHNSSKASMYVKEYTYFKQVMFIEGEYTEMWTELDELNEKLSRL